MGRQKPGEKNAVYRLSLIDNSSHKSIKTVRFTKMLFITVAVTALVVFILAIYCIIAFTPLRSTIPGYPDANYKKVSVANAIKIDSLESVINRWDLYAENLSNVLSGDTTANIDSIVKLGSSKYYSSKSAAELNRQDSILRETVQKEEKFGVSESAGRTLPVEGMHFFAPLKGVVSSGFDDVIHPYIDILAPKGTVVSAVYDGTVIHTGRDKNGGCTIILQHRDGVISVYGNNQELLRNLGDAVKAGTPIAIIGDVAGNTAEEHLHFELWHNGQALNPAKYIGF